MQSDYQSLLYLARGFHYSSGSTTEVSGMATSLCQWNEHFIATSDQLRPETFESRPQREHSSAFSICILRLENGGGGGGGGTRGWDFLLERQILMKEGTHPSVPPHACIS